MTRNRLIRGLAAVTLAVIIAGSLLSYSQGDWQGWGWDASLKNAENAFGFVGAVLAKLHVAFLGRWLGLFMSVSLLLLLAVREFFAVSRKRTWILWGSASLLTLLWSGWLVRSEGSTLASADWGGWFGGLLAEGQEALLGRIGATVLVIFLSLVALLAILPAPPKRRRRFNLPDPRPALHVLTAPFRWIWNGLSWTGRSIAEVADSMRERWELSRERRAEKQEAQLADREPLNAREEEEPTQSFAAVAGAETPMPKVEPVKQKEARPTDSAKRKTLSRKPKPRRSGEYILPDSNLLSPPEPGHTGEDRRQMETQAQVLVDKLATFNIGGRVSAMKQGPVVSTFEFEPEDGVKVSQITGRREDLALALRSKELRLVAPIPGKAAVGIELPNNSPRIIKLREVLDANKFAGVKGNLALALGVDVDGNPTWADLSEAPHLLVAGATGTGKSVCINSILVSLLLQHTPESLRLFLVDPKMLELSVYNDIPHLLHPVITDNKMALQALNWLVGEMETRYKRLKPTGVRNIAEYNTKVEAGEVNDMDGEVVTTKMPFLVCVVEEFADLMMTLGKDVQTPIVRLAQLARAVGIHLILATQRPSVNIIDGVIKANFPSRIAFKVFSRFDSKTILDANGAETLIGRGDMLFMHGRAPYPQRLHGAFVSTEEVEAVTEHWRQYTLPEPPLELETRPGSLQDFTAQDDLYEDAKRIVVLQGFGSTTMLQRRLRVGYTRASRLMDMLEEAGIVGPHTGSKAREVLVGPEVLEEEIET
jgi:DNA segregation ATPase FtsK/SpoIIIE, S-DNA-T family